MRQTRPAEDPGDPLNNLYSKRLDFRNGSPQVSVRIAEGLRTVAFSPQGLAEIRINGPGRPSFSLPAGTAWTVRLLTSQPAKIRQWIQLAEFEHAEAKSLAAAQDDWRARGVQVTTRRLGTLYGIMGKVVDSRKTILLLDEALSAAELSSRQNELFRQFGTRTSIYEELQTKSEGTLELLDAQQHVVTTAKDVIFASAVGNGFYELREMEPDHASKRFRGALEFTVDRLGQLAVVNVVSLEELLKGLVPSEIPAWAPLEALKAQAVSARGEVLAKIGHRHLADPYLLCSEQHCAVYKGMARETPATNKAVEETTGEALFTAKGELVNSVYSAVCGGHTENNDSVWGGTPDPSLRGKSDLLPGAVGPSPESLEAFLASDAPAACQATRFRQPGRYRWQRHFTTTEMAHLTAPLGIGFLRTLSVTERGVSGRAIALVLTGSEGQTEVRGELNIRRLFGNLYSSLFIVRPEQDPRGAVTGWMFRGGGWGHGVGMCQTGAMGRAEAGQNHREILRYYFNGAEVGTLYPPAGTLLQPRPL